MAIRTDWVFAGTGASGTSGAELVYFNAFGALLVPSDATSALVSTAASEVDTCTVAGTPTGGTLTFSFGGQPTPALAYNATTAAVQTAIQGLSTVGAGNILVTGTAGTSYVFTFAGTLASQQVLAPVSVTAALTGGTAPTATMAQTTAGTPGWSSAGLITEGGASTGIKDNTTDIRAFGVAPVVRKLTTSTDITVKSVMMEANKVSTAVWNKLPLGSLAVTSGAFSTTLGAVRTTRYQMVTDLVDGARRLRQFFPNVENTSRDSIEVKTGSATEFGVEFTCYPDSSGNAVYQYWYVPGLV